MIYSFIMGHNKIISDGGLFVVKFEDWHSSQKDHYMSLVGDC